jgi:hypothetical protein
MIATVVAYRTFAMYRAKKLVKEDLRRKGIKVSSVTVCDIAVMAQLYLELHPDLIVEAKETIDKLTLEGAFGKRAQKAALAAQVQT